MATRNSKKAGKTVAKKVSKRDMVRKVTFDLGTNEAGPGTTEIDFARQLDRLEVLFAKINGAQQQITAVPQPTHETDDTITIEGKISINRQSRKVGRQIVSLEADA